MNIPKHKLALLGLAILLLPYVGSALTINWLSPDLEKIQLRAQQEDKLFLLYFTADWCMPCQWMQDNTFQDQDLNQYLDAQILTVKVDLNQAQAKVLQHQFEVEAIPSMLVFAPHGKLLDRRTTSMDARPLLRWLKKLDKPVNHLSATHPLPAQQQYAMNAPKPDLHFSRPALLPDEEQAPLLSVSTSHSNRPSAPPALVLSGEPLAVAQPFFAPRSGKKYGVQLKEMVVDYPTAIRLVSELERKYEQSVELKPDGKGQFFLVLGKFSTTGKAREFLHYLQRNDREGEVIPLLNN